MVKVVLFNGPPRSGKDTCVRILQEVLRARGYWFAQPLKRLTHAIYGFDHLTIDYFEKNKDVAMKEFGNLNLAEQTPRAAYIDVSENAMKPMFGEDVWARRTAKIIADDFDETKMFSHKTFAAVGDLGFQIEVDYFEKKFGPENVLVICLIRDGCDFKNDSRGYVQATNIEAIHNNGGLKQLCSNLVPLVKEFVNRA